MGLLSEFNFDDFYKFIMSVGIISIFGLIILSVYFSIWWMWSITFLISFLIGRKLIYWAGKKWYSNQTIMDEKIRAENELIKKQTSEISLPQNKINNEEKLKDKILSKNNKFALIEYKIDQVLPGTVYFDLVKDKKIWFWISNLESNQYLAYVKTKIKIKDKEFYLEDKGGYYNGKTPWKLNAYTGIRAPGMPIQKHIEEIKNKKDLTITLEVQIKDKDNNLIEEKLPVTYRYDLNKNSWFLEP